MGLWLLVLLCVCVCVCACVGVGVCLHPIFTPSLLPPHTLLHVLSHPSFPHSLSRHVAHTLPTACVTPIFTNPRIFSSPTTRHVDYHGVSPLVSCNVCVFRGFSLSHLKKVRRYLVQKNIAPRVGSCLRFFSPISAPVLSRRFCTRTCETPPTRWKRRRRLPSSCGTSFLHLS